MARRYTLALSLVALLSLLALPTGAAAADTTLTIDTEAVSLDNSAGGILLFIPVTLACAPPPGPGGPPLMVTAQLAQVVNETTIARGYGQLPVTCDATARRYAVPVLAQNAPFREGQAVVSATFAVCTPGPPPGGGCQLVTAGPRVIALVWGPTDGGGDGGA